jgi:hypothetical protein
LLQLTFSQKKLKKNEDFSNEIGTDFILSASFDEWCLCLCIDSRSLSLFTQSILEEDNKRATRFLHDEELPEARKVSKEQQVRKHATVLRNIKKGEVSAISREIETIINKHEVSSPDFGGSAYGELTAYAMESVRLPCWHCSELIIFSFYLSTDL